MRVAADVEYYHGWQDDQSLVVYRLSLNPVDLVGLGFVHCEQIGCPQACSPLAYCLSVYCLSRFALIGFITAVRTTLPARFVTTQRIKARLAMRMLGRKTIRAMTT